MASSSRMNLRCWSYVLRVPLPAPRASARPAVGARRPDGIANLPLPRGADDEAELVGVVVRPPADTVGVLLRVAGAAHIESDEYSIPCN